jgi:hypothetical protein
MKDETMKKLAEAIILICLLSEENFKKFIENCRCG